MNRATLLLILAVTLLGASVATTPVVPGAPSRVVVHKTAQKAPERVQSENTVIVRETRANPSPTPNVTPVAPAQVVSVPQSQTQAVSPPATTPDNSASHPGDCMVTGACATITN